MVENQHIPPLAGLVFQMNGILQHPAASGSLMITYYCIAPPARCEHKEWRVSGRRPTYTSSSRTGVPNKWHSLAS